MDFIMNPALFVFLHENICNRSKQETNYSFSTVGVAKLYKACATNEI